MLDEFRVKTRTVALYAGVQMGLTGSVFLVLGLIQVLQPSETPLNAVELGCSLGLVVPMTYFHIKSWILFHQAWPTFEKAVTGQETSQLLADLRTALTRGLLFFPNFLLLFWLMCFGKPQLLRSETRQAIEF